MRKAFLFENAVFRTPACVSLREPRSQFDVPWNQSFHGAMWSQPSFNVPSKNAQRIQTNIENAAEITLGNFEIVDMKAIPQIGPQCPNAGFPQIYFWFLEKLNRSGLIGKPLWYVCHDSLVCLYDVCAMTRSLKITWIYMLQRVAAWGSVLQCVAAFCHVVQCVAVHGIVVL